MPSWRGLRFVTLYHEGPVNRALPAICTAPAGVTTISDPGDQFARNHGQLSYRKGSLRVLIDLTQIPTGRMGAGSYAENLVGHLEGRGKELALYVVLQSDDPALRQAVPTWARIVTVPAALFRKLPLRLLLEQIYLPWLVLKHKIDVVHSLHYSFPFFSAGAKRVVTIHDMTCYLMPEMHQPLKRQYMRFFIAESLRRAEHLIFISQSARRDAETWFHRSLKNATVIHHGRSNDFRPGLDPSIAKKVRERYGVPEEYILFLGTLEPRKNVKLLVRAFAGLAKKSSNARLVIAGKKGWFYDETFELVKQLALEQRVIFAGYIEESDKAYLMVGALCFVYPSVYEGFGLPVLEAMACGTPTIASNAASLPEVAGDGALLVDPSSLEELSAALEGVYFNAELRASLRRRGLEQAKKFDWDRHVGELVKVYRDADPKPKN